MEALITLYTRATGIEAEKLQMIEDIESYLSIKEPSAPTYTIQYQKIRLNMFVKIILNEQYSSPLQANNYTYVKITNKDNLTKHFYFFVKSLNWKSQDCIELELVMDTLNSFKMGTDYTFSPKTIIQRQHKDRMKYLRESYYIVDTTPVSFLPHMIGTKRFVSEQPYLFNFGSPDTYFNTTLQVYPNEEFVVPYYLDENNQEQQDFVLTLYDKNTRHKVVDSFQFGRMCSYNYYLAHYNDYESLEPSGSTSNTNAKTWVFVSEDELKVVKWDYDTNYYELAIKAKCDMQRSQYINMWYIDSDFIIQDDITWTFYTASITATISEDNLFGKVIDFTNEELNPVLYTTPFTHENAPLHTIDEKLAIQKKKWYLVYIADTDDTNSAISLYLYPETDSLIKTNPPSYTEKIAVGIDKLDRTLARIVKIIEVPYYPYDFELDDDVPVIAGEFSFEAINETAGRIKGTATIDFLRDKLNTDYLSPTNDLKVSIDDTSLIQTRDDNFESKMFHSEFYYRKVLYDSFGFMYKLETINVDEWCEKYYVFSKTPSIDVEYYISNTINSRFGFRFKDYLVDEDKSDCDFVQFLLIKRNNEGVIYTNNYINYIRTGYNYDVKNKNMNNAKNWIMFGGSLLTTTLGIGGAVLSGGSSTPLAIIGISGVVSSVATLTTAITSTIQNERAIDKKQKELQEQATGVSDSDDLGMMNWYMDYLSKLREQVYKPSIRMRTLLKDLFYYYGYKDNITGVPSMNTRYWFNYLKCEPILEFASINMTQEIEDELKGIMRIGFTYYHKQMVNGNKTWDIEQVKENWEVSMLPYLN